MFKKNILYLLVMAWFFVLLGCSNATKPISSAAVAPGANCYIVYDAGSSGTRLFIYEERQGKLIDSHSGPEVSALANPVRGTGDEKFKELDRVIDEVVSALNEIKRKGKKWNAFDWSKQCNVASVKVLATAGMRLAEQKNPELSRQLWKKLKQKLQAELGVHVEVVTKTLTGFEEGLYAWLAIRDEKKRSDFGIVEMGGASSQIAFPCADCDPTNDAVRIVKLDEQVIKFYSYSFLGLGQDEALKVFSLPDDCNYGVGIEKPFWLPSLCADRLTLNNSQGIRDPYNYGHGHRSIYNQLPKAKAKVTTWFLTGAFYHAGIDDIEKYCLQKQESKHRPQTSCFRAVYLEKYLNTLNVPLDSERQKVNWTKGEVICQLNNCLQGTAKPLCRWMDKECL